MNIIPVILSGGVGSRLWPLSREQHPKQYLPLVSSKTMLQETILRLKGLSNSFPPIIVCSVEHRFFVVEQCKEIGIINPLILLEPIGRNTAPAIAAAALRASTISKNSLLLILSADHQIDNVASFHESINIATSHAKKGKLVTFGVIPSSANTQYGYIKSEKNNEMGAFTVKEFIEKPDLDTAKNYLKEGNYYWNSGMFMFQAEAFLIEIDKFAPKIMKLVSDALENSTFDLGFTYLEKKAFELCPSISIDYAVMEKSKNVVVIPLDCNWSDIGSWSALYEQGEKDKNSNVIIGDVVSIGASNCYINASHHLLALIGVDDIVVIDTPDATLISSKEKVTEVKKILSELKIKERTEQSYNRKVYRPWGWYDSIETGMYFQVKKLHVNPHSKLSLQMHNKRAEHWVVVQGVASVINGDRSFNLTPGESTYIPLGTKHGLENKTNDPLEIIEVQSGTYLGEDDIVRFEDVYGRLKI